MDVIMIYYVNLIGMINMIGYIKVNLNVVKFLIKKVKLIIFKNMNIEKYR